MSDLRVLIAAAGAGTRAGLPYPKTLHPVGGKPILGRILALMAGLDPEPTIIVSATGRDAVARYVADEGRHAHLIVQAVPTGMGDAVLHFARSPAASGAGTVILAWGDLPYLSEQTLAATLAWHGQSGAALTFPSRHVDRAYTVVERGPDGAVRALRETRTSGADPAPGERDIGLFVFEAEPVLDALRQSAAEHDPAHGEHGFLQVVGRLAAAGCRVEALPVATERELISLNALSDLEVDR